MLALITLTLTGIKDSQATHSAGLDLTYKCLGNNLYEVSLIFERDCSGGNAAAPDSVIIFLRSSCFPGQIYNLGIPKPTPTPVTPTCGQGGFCVEEYVYKRVFDFTPIGQCADWKLYYSQIGQQRNGNITTIQNPLNTWIYTEATFNNLDAPCNSSPEFDNIPTIFVCLNQETCWSSETTDPDGDSLSYELVQPMSWTAPNQTSPVNWGLGNTTPLQYTTGYSITQPMSGTVTLTGGDLCFTVDRQDVGVVAVKVTQWNNGTIVGTQIRDAQIQVVICNNLPPYNLGINDAGYFRDTLCPNTLYSFTTTGLDNDPTHKVTFSIDGVPMGASFTDDGSPRPGGVFSWTPHDSLVGKEKCFDLTVTDDGCPQKDTTYTYCFFIRNDMTLSFNKVDAECGQNNGEVDALPANGNPAYTYAWSNGATTKKITGVGEGSYSVTVTDSKGCTVLDSASIVSNGILAMSLTKLKDADCGVDSGSAQVTVTTGTAPFNVSWSSGDTTFIVEGLAGGNYTVNVTDSRGCANSDSVTINSTEGITVVIGPKSENGCDRFGGNDGRAKATAMGGVPPYTYQWNDPAQQTTDSAVGLATGTYIVTATDSNGCQVSENVVIEDKIIVSGSVVSQPTCGTCSDGVATVNFTGTGTPPFSFRWDDDNEQTTQTATGLKAGQYVVIVTDINGCSNEDTVYVGIFGIEEFASTPIQVYPNPSQGVFNLNVGNSTDYIFNVYNTTGTLVLSGRRNASLTTIDLNQSPPGIYLMEVLVNGQRSMARLQVLD